MTIHAEDLPKAVRDKLGITAKGRGSKPSRANTGHAAPCAGTCSCGHRSDRYSAHEEHLLEAHPTSGARWSIDL